MRRVITLLLTVAMALSLVVVASASQTVYLRVDEEQSGNTVTYTFTLDASSSDGVGAMEFYVETKGLSLTGKPVYNNRGTQLDAVFKVADGEAGTGDYRFYENQNYFIAWGGNSTLSTPRVLRGEVVLVALTYTITDSSNYGLTVKSGSFKACYSGDKAMTDPYACKVRTGDVMKGDVNGDGNINIFDALMILQHIKGDIDLSDVPAADVNGDGNINIFDALMILQHIKGDIDLTA
jgi:hypothetical protein